MEKGYFLSTTIGMFLDEHGITEITSSEEGNFMVFAKDWL